MHGYLQKVRTIPCTITGHAHYNSLRAPIYVETYGIYSSDDFKRKLAYTHPNIIDITFKITLNKYMRREMKRKFYCRKIAYNTDCLMPLIQKKPAMST